MCFKRNFDFVYFYIFISNFVSVKSMFSFLFNFVYCRKIVFFSKDDLFSYKSLLSTKFKSLFERKDLVSLSKVSTTLTKALKVVVTTKSITT